MQLAVHIWCNGRSCIRSIVIVRVALDSWNFTAMRFLNALTELSARARTFAGGLSSSFSFSLLFFQDITPLQRDLHNCERLFVLVSWPPHTRFRTLGALLWSWFICKWLGTPAHDGAELKTDAYWTTFSLSLPIYPSLFRIHTSTFIFTSSLSLSSLSLFLCQASSFSFSPSPFLYFFLPWCVPLFSRFSSVHRVSLGSIWKSCSSANTVDPCILWLQFPAQFWRFYTYT